MALEGSRQELIVDGQLRAIEANRGRIQAEVRARYARELHEAGPLRRLFLRARIELEIRRRLKRLAPDDALYAMRS